MLDTPTLFAGLIFGSIGFGYFIYGKKQSNTVVKITGILLIMYTYFFDNPITIVLVGLGLMILPRFVDLD